MNTPFFEYYISVYDKNGLPLSYGKKMSVDTFTMDGVKMILDTDPNYQITDIDLSDKVLDMAGFSKLNTSQYNLPTQPNDIYYHIPVLGNKIVEVLFRGGRWYYVKPNHPSVEFKPIATISALQTEAYNECSDLKLPLLKTIINKKKLYSYLVSHIQGDYIITSLKVDANGKKTHSTNNFNYLLLDNIVINALPVIEVKIIDAKNASIDIHTTGIVHATSFNKWTDVVKANPSLPTMPHQEVEQIREAHQLIVDAVSFSKDC